ncbi:MAG: PQQ-binding-like beta-propeller repeat protein, partial [Myxococcota bacterium]|nr:PQQ-binding-like beta-propeller repeat protein [Myxococcota bacterium]
MLAAAPGQKRNLRFDAFCSDLRFVDAWRRDLHAKAIVNRDPDPYRVAAPEATDDAGGDGAPLLLGEPRRMRYAQRWHLEAEGLDLCSTFLCGDRLVVSTVEALLAVDRDSGEVIWRLSPQPLPADAGSAASIAAGSRGLARASADGRVVMLDLSTGAQVWSSRVQPRVGRPAGIAVGPGRTPRLLVLAEGTGPGRRLVALDVHTGEQRWRFSARRGGAPGDGFEFVRAGRLLVVACGDASIYAIDSDIGAVVWRFGGAGGDLVRAGPRPDPRPPTPDPRVRIAAMAVFGVSGFVAMNYQVAWNRVLSMVIGGSVYSFTTILLAFLVGIAIGSSVASALMRRIRNPVFWLAVVQVWIGLASAAGYFLADEYPWLFAWLIDRLGGGRGASDATVLLIGFGVAALALLPSTIGMGAAMPLTVRVCAVARDRIGRDVGTIYAANTVGAIAGSFLSAFVLLPALSSASFALFGAGHGLQLLIGLCVLLNLCAGTALLVAMPTRRAEGGGADVRAQVFRWVAVPFVPALGVILILATAGRGWTWDADRLVAGSFRLAYLPSILTGERRAEMLYFRDGVSTTVSVQRWDDHVAMKNNGKVDASTGDDMPTQVMVAGLPIVLHPRGPEGLRVAVIGFGSGVSVGAALGLPVARVDAVELEPAVIESSYHFREVNMLEYGPPSGRRPGALAPHPRLRVFSNDGRNFLASTSERYDVVVSEPSNPWITGVSNLFTLDHFLAARQALAPGGLFCQWVQLYEMSEESVASIMRTFASAFPHVRVFSASPQASDVIMIGSDDPIPIDIRRLRAALARRDAAEVFAPDRTEIAGADDIVARLIMADRAELLEFAGRATINTDDNAFIEFQAPLDMIRFARSDDAVVARLYGKAWRWGRIDLRRMRETGYEPEGADAAAQIHAVSEALVRGGRAAWAADLILEAATAPSVAFAPDREQADDMLRSLRSGRDRSAARPAAGRLR